MTPYLPIRTKFYITCARCNTQQELFAPGCDIRAEKAQFMDHLLSLGWEARGLGETVTVCPSCARRNPS
jgi:hypothetical protein